MGSSSSTKNNQPEYIEELIDSSQKVIKKYQTGK